MIITNNLKSRKQNSRRFEIWTLFVVVTVVSLILWQHQAVYDWFRLRDYTPSSDIAQIALDDGLTESAKRAFYVNHPAIQDKAAFAQVCPNGDKETAVLGCYIPDQRGIYVLSVSDARLAGIEQVTAAHEILHAMYDRLSASDRKQVDTWLMDYYKNELHDQTILNQVNIYKKTEPDALVNEMHAIFGTEVNGLPTNLENYYRRYFLDRSKVVGYYTTYQAEFTSRILRIKQDDARLNELKAQIAAGEADVKSKQLALNSKQAELESNRRSGNIAAYNAGVEPYNALVDAFNAKVREVQNLVAQYNQLVSERNAIVLEEQQLTQQISSQVSPINNR